MKLAFVPLKILLAECKKKFPIMDILAPFGDNLEMKFSPL